MGPNQYPVQWLPRAFSLRIKWPGCEGDQSLPSSDKIAMRGPAHPLPLRHTDDFTLPYTSIFLIFLQDFKLTFWVYEVC